MAKNTLSEIIKTVQDGEDGDQAYARLFGDQMKPCTFRRVFSAVARGEGTTEVGGEVVAEIQKYVSEKMNVDEAFKTHCPDFVGPGEFANAYEKEMKARKGVPSSPKVVLSKKPVAVSSPEDKPSV